ncbi:pilus assembly protein TadG-related protein [Tsuneonella sp. YG55]|uniref:Pilus assembly protein TadG-related protein n=1 Tax=Tsuneonella litorea TaxID=2976475 RepID=A0A9X2W047_9SPHN|nr:Tad domain-containing protein [Tsuneonella litorea]MCT2558665.1 pilus assembly protein TadG-related protein [Tsuneonella litorea]
MKNPARLAPVDRIRGFFARIARDRAGNTLALIAAAIAPIMAMVGGGVDMGRSYMAQARLQQACDAGVLAARKRLGSEVVVTGVVPTDAAMIGQRYFNINYRAGAYGSTDRSFVMTLEQDYAVSGVAKVTVPTTIMRVFGFNQVPVKVDCEAQINFSNTDVMMVLDVTGSMAQTNPGDTSNRIDVLKNTVRGFYQQLQASAQAGTRIRYGFVPYSTNVNVGGLLKDDWVVGSWTYQSRRIVSDITKIITFTYWTKATYVSGTASTAEHSTYAASFDEMKGYYCPTAPSNSVSTTTSSSTTTETITTPLPGVRTTTTYVRTRNGYAYSVYLVDTTCHVTQTTYTDYKDTYQQVTEPALGQDSRWEYAPLTFDVANWRSEGNGCIEERDTYKITNYDAVDLSRARDLDIDLVPSPGVPGTQWRPMYPSLVYARAVEWSGSGSFTKVPITTDKEFVQPYALGSAACPPPAMNMTTLTQEDLDAYLATLKPNGSTYHDIGMIWGGRLISPTGLFAAENADTSPSSPTSRHLIFLTDGETAPYDLSYSSYGIEPIDGRRWDATTPMSLTKTVENRFAFACKEVKKRNVTVWVIGFGTALSDVFKDCAGTGHFFEAADAAELNATFATIARNLSQLRIQR